MTSSHQSRSFLLVVALALAMLKGTADAFTFTTTRLDVKLTKPTTFTAPTRRSVAPLHYRNREDEGVTNVNNVVKNRLENKKRDSKVMIPTRDEPSSTTMTSTARQFVQSGIHHPIIRAIAISQAATLVIATLVTIGILFATGNSVDLNSLHWNWGNDFHSLLNFHLTPVRLVQGVVAAIPMIYLGNKVEESDGRDESHVNFSTTNMVMTLFGRRKLHQWWDIFPTKTPPSATTTNESTTDTNHPVLRPETSMMQALPVALGIAMMTGIAEETVFRGMIPSLISQFSGSTMAALFGQAALFGLGHLSPKSGPGENRIVCAMQGINGLWHGLVYLSTGGDVMPCIIAHALYDSHVFMETWKSINDQMDYTEQQSSLKTLPQNEQDDIQQIKMEAGPNLDDKTLDFTKSFFYAFDYDHKGSLSRSDVQRAVSYAFLQDAKQPSQEYVDAVFDKMLQRRQENGVVLEEEELKERLRLPDFLRVLFFLKSKSQQEPVTA